jgi:alpha-beta hydrolase superfamily lysophospholipase
MSDRLTRVTRVVARLLIALFLGFAGLNALAYSHARAFTRFSDGPERTQPPQRLSMGQKFEVLFTGAKVPRPTNHRTPADIGLAFERHVFEGYRRIPLEAWLVPAESPRGIVVLFHGHAAAKDTLLRPAAVLHDLGWSVLLVDFHGSGGSGGRETSIGFHEADDVAGAAVYAAELPGRGPVVLHGQSMGAAAILLAAGRRRPSVQGVILECPFDRLSTTVEHRFEDMGVPAFPSAGLLVFWGGVQQGFDGFRSNPIDAAGSIDCPALLMNGARDPWVRPSEARAIFERLAGPKTFHEFEGLGHQSYLEARPDEWTAAVRAFLASVAS